MEKLEYLPYRMISNPPLNSQSTATEKKGYLIRRICKDESILYSDVFTWPEMGDPSVDQVMSELCKATQLKSQQTSQLTSKPTSQRTALWCELALSNLRTITPTITPMFDSQTVVSHYLYNWGESLCDSTFVDSTIRSQEAQILANPASTVKFKLFQNWHTQIETLHKVADMLGSAGRLRLDFNSCLDENAFFEFEKKTRILHKQIEFIEDPTPFNYAGWAKMNQVLPLALDFEIRNYLEWNLQLNPVVPSPYTFPSPSHAHAHSDVLPDVHSDGNKPAFDWVIFKPAVQRFSDVENFLAQNKKIVVTSYLGHPISQQITKLLHLELMQHHENTKTQNSIHPVGGWIHQHLYKEVIEGAEWLSTEHFLKN